MAQVQVRGQEDALAAREQESSEPSPEAVIAEALVQRLRSHADDDTTYWTFAGNDKRRNGHALFSYPAMMVPQLQGALLDDLVAVDPHVRNVYDPFAGSGTVLVECMLRGLGFTGSDINPLAVLIMMAKSMPLEGPTLAKAVSAVINAASKDTADNDVQFRGIDKWFKPAVARKLAALRRAIRAQSDNGVRRFLWVALAETVRRVSNSRTSTFKLHVYAAETLQTWNPDALAVFADVAKLNLEQISSQRQKLSDAGYLKSGQYRYPIHLLLADASKQHLWPSRKRADALMTSPPYGDNLTTVPYGQHAFLPLSWIDRTDLGHVEQVEHLMGSPYRTDVASLGGRGVLRRYERYDSLLEKSDYVRSTAEKLREFRGDGEQRLLAFCTDLDRAINSITARLRPGAIMFWTLGERKINGIQIPTTSIVAELCGALGARELTVIEREIPNNAKRMALRNNTVTTMSTELVLVMQVACINGGRKVVRQQQSGTAVAPAGEIA